ncbi:hypothetical protein HPB51_018045 [Rhipicephalus microplus]|uniref:C2H2-type domain-containing protein n=1 Tax=Rhipicephalus microplus TaxID=6941 RepID=A0A9J6DPN4_RHIMP|nr:hypothetical protein HPB51_018045 [Rhipicephalus microplus]
MGDGDKDGLKGIGIEIETGTERPTYRSREKIGKMNTVEQVRGRGTALSDSFTASADGGGRTSRPELRWRRTLRAAAQPLGTESRKRHPLFFAHYRMPCRVTSLPSRRNWWFCAGYPSRRRCSGEEGHGKRREIEERSAHLPIRKRITLRIQESADVLEEWGLAGEVVVNEAAEAVVEVKAAVERNTCQYCSKRFNSSSKHRLHELRHRSKLDGRYRCIKCGKCFVQNSSLMTHVRSHTGERPYHCKVCGADFGDVSCYNKHKRTHTGDRPYNCFGCAKAFTQSGNLYRHMRICAKVKNMAPNLA